MTPDASTHWSHRLPGRWRAFASLARWDRPVGYWLLALPGWAGIALAGLTERLGLEALALGLLILVGAVAMRGAGCTYNDIVDRDLDAAVERTRSRPLPSGAVSVRAAWGWLLAQCLVGLIVLLMLPNLQSRIVALASLPLVAAYPFMKRMTGFPQVWLGLTFNWAALVAYAAMTGVVTGAAVLLYLGLAAWTLGYDTIYALQDIEDDQMAGIRSSAISFGPRVRMGVALSYMAALGLIVVSALSQLSAPLSGDPASDTYWVLANGHLVLLAVLPVLVHFAWQVARLEADSPAVALRLFKSNRLAGFLIVLALAALGLTIR